MKNKILYIQIQYIQRNDDKYWILLDIKRIQSIEYINIGYNEILGILFKKLCLYGNILKLGYYFYDFEIENLF